MLDAQITHDPRVLTIAVSGVVSRERVMALVRELYPTLGGRSILWDFRRGDLTGLEQRDRDAVAELVATLLDRRTPRKTAYVVADQAAYVSACKYLNTAARARVPAEYSVFTSESRAREWLEQT